MYFWQDNYYMNKSEWKKPYFIRLIGGIETPKEKKERNHREKEKYNIESRAKST